ncbi:hypothetical protein [Hydrogenophaga taeniospiralis]|uniref:Acb2/Tad1 domain-containing protein n=1 Tax=Hydrogenophaga taeniospiralis TaxID=65656 RepID=UPI001CFC4543|nr:hypothetical protein [Hydrogenophaga taeniospiralis]UCU94003.1 hypothetical protein KI616_25250 [Hydrogenophaga taeniospiralis]
MNAIVETKVTPSIGDSVLLHLNGMKPTFPSLDILGDQPLAGTVVYVWGPDMVNLVVYDHRADAHSMQSVKFVQPGADVSAIGMYCELDCILGDLIEGELIESDPVVPVHDFGTEGIVAANPDRPLSFGERAVGLQFNPSNQTAVYQCKSKFAALIDQLEARRQSTTDSEVKRLCSIAITEAQTAQMWAVKALTWES